MSPRSKTQRAELHAHLGSSVAPAILWSIAHQHGIRLPSKDYWDFEDMVTMAGNERNKDLDDMHDNFFHWTELIQSSPKAIEDAVSNVIGGGYRKCNITLQELRFNPMFRNRGGEKDLDHIIVSALWGIDRAMLEYPQVKAGIILMMDRSLTYEQNYIIARKAIRYKNKGIVGIDIGGPQRKTFSMKKHAHLFKEARDAGLGITIHTGEEGSLEEMKYVVREIKPERIGQGLLCIKDKKLMQDIVNQGIVLESCPTSNLRNSVVKNIAELRKIFKTYLKYNIKFTINTDGPEMYKSNICQEQDLLIKNKILTPSEVKQATKWAFESTFIK